MNLNKLKNSTLSPPTRVIKNSSWPNLITQSQQKHKKHDHWMTEKCRQLQTLIYFVYWSTSIYASMSGGLTQTMTLTVLTH